MWESARPALVTPLVRSGLRIGEALALWLEDVDVARYQLHVRDRGELPNGAEIKTPAAERTIDISPELIYQIMDYAVVAHTEEIETNHVFLKMRGPHAGQPLEYADVNDLFQRLKSKTGIDASAQPSRSTFEQPTTLRTIRLPSTAQQCRSYAHLG